MSELILSQPDPGENRQVSAKDVTAVTFDFPTEAVTLDLDGANLVIEFDNGGKIVIQGVLEQDPARLPELHIQDGTVLSMRELLHNMQYDPIVGPYDDDGCAPSPEAGPHTPHPAILLSAGDGLIEGLLGGLPGIAPAGPGQELFPPLAALTSIAFSADLPPASQTAEMPDIATYGGPVTPITDDELQRLYVALQLRARPAQSLHVFLEKV